MFDTERDVATKHGINEHNIILEEYRDIVEDLKRDLHSCKVEQNNLRSEFGLLQNGNQSANEIRESFERIHLEECGSQDSFKKELKNLQERLELLQTEKDSTLQLWHASLNAIDVLEEELKGYRADGKGVKFYQEQVTALKETYSQAIKTLEGKLLQAKENFLNQQAMCRANEEKVENLSKAKHELMHELSVLRKEVQDKGRSDQITIETLRKELSYARAETDKVAQQKLELERKLNEVKRYAENVVERDKETKTKMAEAIELIESAVREKDLALHREMLIIEEKTRLEHRLASIADEYDAKIKEINLKTKEELESNAKRYLAEIKDLKSELREKAILSDRAQTQLNLSQEELEKVRRDLNGRILDYERKIKCMEVELRARDETKNRDKWSSEIERLKEMIATLKVKLAASDRKLQKLEERASSNANERTKQADLKSEDVTKRYSDLENQLAQTLGAKEDLIIRLKSLKDDFDYETHKRDNERQSLEDKIHVLDVNLQKANCSRQNAALLDPCVDQLDGPVYDTKVNRTLDVTAGNKCHCCRAALSDRVNKLQEKFERKTKEFARHVQVHQRLSKRWRDEATSLTARFQGKTKELKSKLNGLRKENNELRKELLTWKQRSALCSGLEENERCNEGNEIR